MDINYKLLRSRIGKIMENNVMVKEEYASYDYGYMEEVLISKKDSSALNILANSLKEKESMRNEIKRLRMENEELKKENNAKNSYKNYILEIDKIMDKLPSTKDYSKKVELISRFVEWSLAVFNKYENIGLTKTARYGYTERIILIRAVLSKYYVNVLQTVTKLVEMTSDSKDKGERLLTLDKFITDILYKDANLKEKEIE